jgi:3-hydroxybutyryl-CoA dehydrogenase
VSTIGVIGAGTMGIGIALVALEAGETVILHDVDGEARAAAGPRLRDGLVRSAARPASDRAAAPAEIDATMRGFETTDRLEDAASVTRVVIEAAFEDLDLKREIFRRLDADAPHDVILATNTSALSVAAIADATVGRARVLGLHFFNPVPRMALVEVIATEQTDPSVTTRAEALLAGWGKTPVRSADTPGFIVNRVNRPFTIEALRMLEMGEATPEAIDEAIRAAGYPMGPFELMDLIGLDVNLSAARAVWDGLSRPDRLRPSPIQERLVAEGRLGRKRGRGFYRYDDGRRSSEGAGDWPVQTSPPAADIVARIESAIADEARRAVADDVATPDDIALALRLGAGHPRSPFQP